MKTIICKFKSEGKTVKKTAILTDSLDELSKSKKNEATDLVEADDLSYWSLYFCVSEALGYEVEFKYNRKNYVKTLIPIKAITWGGADAGVVIDAQRVSVTIR